MSEPDKMADAKAKFGLANKMAQHKKKVACGIALTVAIGLLEAWPVLCPLIPYNLQCAATAPLAKIGAEKLKEMNEEEQDGAGGGHE